MTANVTGNQTLTPITMHTFTYSSTDDDVEALKRNFDDFYLLINGFLVFLMQPGFALLECGAVRSKNATNILIKNLLDCMIAGVAYYLCGYAFAFGKGNSFIGHSYFAAANLPIDKHSHWFFQYVFAATAATIVSGSLAERCDTTAYFTYSFIITGFLYPIVSHWTWTDEGWLAVGDGISSYTDFAGSGVVHVVGGTCALVGAILLGPRIGRFDPDTGEPVEIRGHSIPLTFTGGMILLMGFLPFNGGSLGSISNPGDGGIVSRVVFNTIISGCFGGLTTLILVRLGVLGRPKVLSGIHSLNGALAGMVSICCGCNDYYPWASAIIGSFAGVIYLLVHIIIGKCKIDDPLDAIPVHLGGGIWGLLAAPFLKISDGIFFHGSKKSSHLLAWNLAGAAAIFTWSAGISLLMFGSLKFLKKLRVDADTELKGLDIVKHNEPAYPGNSWLEEQYVVTAKFQDGRKVSVDINLPPHMKLGKLRQKLKLMDGNINNSFISEEDEIKGNGTSPEASTTNL